MKVIAVNNSDYVHLKAVYESAGLSEGELLEDIEEIREGLV